MFQLESEKSMYKRHTPSMEEGYDRELQVDMWALQWQKVYQFLYYKISSLALLGDNACAVNAKINVSMQKILFIHNNLVFSAVLVITTY